MPVSGSVRTSMRSSANSIPASGLKNPAVSMWRSNRMVRHGLLPLVVSRSPSRVSRAAR